MHFSSLVVIEIVLKLNSKSRKVEKYIFSSLALDRNRFENKLVRKGVKVLDWWRRRVGGGLVLFGRVMGRGLKSMTKKPPLQGNQHI